MQIYISTLMFPLHWHTFLHPKLRMEFQAFKVCPDLFALLKKIWWQPQINTTFFIIELENFMTENLKTGHFPWEPTKLTWTLYQLHYVSCTTAAMTEPYDEMGTLEMEVNEENILIPGLPLPPTNTPPRATNTELRWRTLQQNISIKANIQNLKKKKKKISVYFNFTGRVQGDKAILPKNYLPNVQETLLWLKTSRA